MTRIICQNAPSNGDAVVPGEARPSESPPPSPQVQIYPEACEAALVDPGITRYVKRTGSTHRDAPFEFLKLGPEDFRWSSFTWLSPPAGRSPSRTPHPGVRRCHGTSAYDRRVLAWAHKPLQAG